MKNDNDQPATGLLEGRRYEVPSGERTADAEHLIQKLTAAVVELADALDDLAPKYPPGVVLAVFVGLGGYYLDQFKDDPNSLAAIKSMAVGVANITGAPDPFPDVTANAAGYLDYIGTASTALPEA